MSLDEFILQQVAAGALKVTPDGRVWSIRGGGQPKELTPRIRNEDGYLAVDLWDGQNTRTAYVHRIVYMALHGSLPEGYEIDHIDRNRQNNSITNLRAVHRSDNSLNKEQSGENNPSSKLNWPQVREIRRLYGTGPSQRDLARMFGVSPATIRTVVKKMSWWPDTDSSEDSTDIKGLMAYVPPSHSSDVGDGSDSSDGITAAGLLKELPKTPEELQAEWEQQQALLLWEGTKLDQQPERYEDAKAAYAATYGNAARAARLVGLHSDTLRQYAARDNWPTTPTPSEQPKTSAEKASRSRIEHMAAVMEAKLYTMLDSMIVEEKARGDIAEKGLFSQYVAPLSQRSTSFKIIFDSWMRLKTILEPEQFGNDFSQSNPHAMRLQRQKELTGGVEGVERQLAAFFAGVNVSSGDSREPVAIMDAEVISDRERGFAEISEKTGLGQGDSD